MFDFGTVIGFQRVIIYAAHPYMVRPIGKLFF